MKKLTSVLMKIFFVGLILSFLSACAVTHSKVPVLKPDGQVATLPTGEAAMMEVNFYRLFYKSNVVFEGKQFNLVYGSDASTELQRNMLVLQSMAEYAAKVYGQSQGIPMPSSTAPSAENNGNQVSVGPLIKQ